MFLSLARPAERGSAWSQGSRKLRLCLLRLFFTCLWGTYSSRMPLVLRLLLSFGRRRVPQKGPVVSNYLVLVDELVLQSNTWFGGLTVSRNPTIIKELPLLLLLLLLPAYHDDRKDFYFHSSAIFTREGTKSKGFQKQWKAQQRGRHLKKSTYICMRFQCFNIEVNYT